MNHAFTQVLQTEINKPLSIRFQARRHAAGGWWSGMALLAAGFLLLWGGVAWVSRSLRPSATRE